MNLCDIKTVKRIMAEFGTGTKKSFGQNFLINAEIPFNIAEESYSYHKSKHPTIDSGVIEIGPGIGSLTYELGQRYNKAVAVEIDSTLIPILEKTLGELDNVTVINGDFLKLETEKLINDNFGNIPVSVCANLPYYITTPIIMKLLEESRVNGKNRLTSITVMVQKEVADRLCATEKDKDYGAITVSVQAVADVTITRILPRELFYPAPNVDSAVVRIDLQKDKFDIDDHDFFRKVVKISFAMRRKTLVNNLMVGFKMDRATAENVLAECDLSPNCRGEELSVEKFVELYKVLQAKNIK